MCVWSSFVYMCLWREKDNNLRENTERDKKTDDNRECRLKAAKKK